MRVIDSMMPCAYGNTIALLEMPLGTAQNQKTRQQGPAGLKKNAKIANPYHWQRIGQPILDTFTKVDVRALVEPLKRLLKERQAHSMY